jgi:hypothetical protein
VGSFSHFFAPSFNVVGETLPHSRRTRKKHRLPDGAADAADNLPRMCFEKFFFEAMNEK